MRLAALANNDVGCALRTKPRFNETHGAQGAPYKKSGKIF